MAGMTGRASNMLVVFYFLYSVKVMKWLLYYYLYLFGGKIIILKSLVVMGIRTWEIRETTHARL